MKNGIKKEKYIISEFYTTNACLSSHIPMKAGFFKKPPHVPNIKTLRVFVQSVHGEEDHNIRFPLANGN
jgi:hypothetical protein